MRGKQRYRCSHCKHQFVPSIKQLKWIYSAYQDYSVGKQTLSELALKYNKSTRTLRRYFDQYSAQVTSASALPTPINLILDATFFGRTDGVFVFRANKKNLAWYFIETETLHVVQKGIMDLEQQGVSFKSFTIDGRKGVIRLLQTCYRGIPIQLCQFHQAQIIRRYITQTPKTECGQALKELMKHLTTTINPFCFAQWVILLQQYYSEFLKERNEKGQFQHRKLRSAFRSLQTNLPYLFTYQLYPELKIPNTTNSCDGSFAHWKQKIKIHRGLRKERRNKMISFLLNLN